MFLVDVLNNKTEVVDCDGELQSLYDLIKCEYVEIVERTINGVRCNIICDEEGKLHEAPKISGIMYDNNDYFVGNLLICGLSDSEGDLTGLKDDEIDAIKNHIIDFEYNHEMIKVLVGIEY